MMDDEDELGTEPAFLGESDEGDEVLADLDGAGAPPDSDEDDAADGADGDDAMAVAPAPTPPLPPLPEGCTRLVVDAHSSVYAVAAFLGGPQGDVVATGGEDDTARLWPVQGTGSRALSGHTDSVAAVAFSGDGTLLATCGMDGRALVWDAATGELRHTFDGPGGGLEWVQWHPRGHLLLSGSEDGTSWMWNADDGECMQVFAGHAGPVTCGGFTPDGKAIVTTSEDSSLRLWNPRSGECSLTVTGYPFHTAGITCLDMDTAGNALTGSQDGTLKLVSLASGKVAATLAGHSASVEAAALCDSAPYAASGGQDGVALVWDLHTASIRSTCGHGGEAPTVSRLRWLAGSTTMVTATTDGHVRLWDARTGQCSRTWQVHGDAVLDLWVDPGGRSIVTCGDDGSACVIRLV